MTTTITSVDSQLFIIIIIDFDQCCHNSLSLQCSENELVGHLCEHFKIPVDRYRPISLSTLIEWLNDEDIIIDIFNNKGKKLSPDSSKAAPYSTKYILNDKLGNIVDTLTEQIVLQEYLIKLRELDVIANLDTPSEIQSACERTWENSIRWSIIRLADMEPLCITVLNLD